MILVCPLLLAIRAMAPRAGASRGIQYRMITRSGFVRLSRSPVLNQLKGFIELIARVMVTPSGAYPSSYCVLPGKRKEGYCILNVKMAVAHQVGKEL